METQLNFTQDEEKMIREITETYSLLFKEAIKIQDEITESEARLTKLINEMDDLKKTELAFFEDLAVKFDLEPQTVANAAANYVLTQRK